MDRTENTEKQPTTTVNNNPNGKSRLTTLALLLFCFAMSGNVDGAIPDSTKLVATPGQMGFLVGDCSLVGKGHIQMNADTVKNGNKILTGTITIDRILFSNNIAMPVSIPFRIEIVNTPFGNSGRWGSNVTSAELNGSQVIAFADGGSNSLSLSEVVSASNMQPGFVDDLVRIFNKTDKSAPPITTDLCKEHPLLASYEYGTSFSVPDKWKQAMNVARCFFASGNATLGELAFGEIMHQLSNYENFDPQWALKLGRLALDAMNNSTGEAFLSKMRILEDQSITGLATSQELSSKALAILLSKRAVVPRGTDDAYTIDKAISRLKQNITRK